MRLHAPVHPAFRRPRTWLVLFLLSVALLRLVTREGSRPLLNWAPHRIASETPGLYHHHRQQQTNAGDEEHENNDRLCRAHGWRPFEAPRGGRRRKVFDLVMVGGELDWLEIRLNTTYDHVDHFILVEASQTFTGLPKPLALRQGWDRLAPYHDKLVYHELVYPPDFRPPRPWDREDLQRDAMLLQVFPRLLAGADAGPGDGSSGHNDDEGPFSRAAVAGAAPQRGDVLVVADADEILRPETLAVLRACSFPRRLTLRSRFHYYSFEFLHRGAEWQHPQATVWDGLAGTILPVNLRNGDGGPQPWIWWDKADLWNSGWHCSYCYDSIERVLAKMAATSHLSQNEERFRARDRMADRVRAGRDLWDREGQFYDRLENNTDVPPLILHRRDEFGYLLDRSGKSAGFKDYPP